MTGSTSPSYFAGAMPFARGRREILGRPDLIERLALQRNGGLGPFLWIVPTGGGVCDTCGWMWKNLPKELQGYAFCPRPYSAGEGLRAPRAFRTRKRRIPESEEEARHIPAPPEQCAEWTVDAATAHLPQKQQGWYWRRGVIQECGILAETEPWGTIILEVGCALLWERDGFPVGHSEAERCHRKWFSDEGAQERRPDFS